MTDQPNAVPTLFRQKLELLIQTQDEDVLSHVREMISLHKLTFRYFQEDKIDLPRESAEIKKPAIILVTQKANENIETFSARIGTLLENFPKASIFTVLNDSSLQVDLQEAEHQRVYPLSKNEFLKTAKFETLVLAKSRSQYFTILPTDLFPMTSIDFTAYVQLSLNQRYLTVLFKKLILTEERLARLARAPGLLIPITESPGYHTYISTYYDTTGASLKKRARSLFYSLASSWMVLFDYVTLDYKTLPETQIQTTFAHLETVTQEIVDLLQKDEDLWETFKDVSSNPFFKLWRSPWIAIYATIISVKSGLGNPAETLIAGLFSDIGLAFLDSALLQKYLDKGLHEATAEEKIILEKYPMESLNRSLSKKLPLSENIKSIIATSSERFDGTGFPNQVPGEKIPDETFLLRFAQLIDHSVRTTFEESGVGFRFMREKLWEAQKQNTGTFPPVFLEKIANALL